VSLQTTGGRPVLVFTRDFNDHYNGTSAALAVKPLAGGGQQLIIGNNEIVLLLCKR
jgi:hypothetical protein